MTKALKLPPLIPTLGPEEVSPILEQGFGQIPQPTPHATRVAVVVAHGMGQQVPYETIEDVVQAIQRGMAGEHKVAEKRGVETGTPISADALTFGQPEIRSVRLGAENKADVETELVRAEVKVTDKQGNAREVHVYEAYWAPLTEGKVTIGDTMSFLWDAGFTGFLNTTGRTFRRWMFGNEQQFALSTFSLCFYLFLVVAMLGSLTVINGVAVAAAASRAIGTAKNFPQGNSLIELTWDFVIADAAAILIAVGFLIFGKLTKIGFFRKVVWSFTILGGAGIVASAVLMCVHLASKPENIVLAPTGAWWQTFVDGSPLLVLLLWSIEIYAASKVRVIVIQYVGDVAAYISGARVSKFWELRQQIWNTCMKVVRAVYRAQDADNTGFLYHKIVVVGHSLGSVIAYDLLNGLLMEDLFSSTRLDVSKRTPMLLTFGSPLDKTAFFFRTRKDMDSPIREVGAAAVQPLIETYANRPKKWINLWSRSDIISGHLDYYDPPNKTNAKNKGIAFGAADHRAIQNEIDPDATTPLTAHVQYWEGKLFAKHLVDGILD